MQDRNRVMFFPRGDVGVLMRDLEECYGGEGFVWATPGVPLIPFITVGLLFSVLYWVFLLFV